MNDYKELFWSEAFNNNKVVKIRMKYISQFINGFAFSSDDFSFEGANKVIRIGDIADDIVLFKHAISVNFEVPKEYQVKRNDVLIAMSGATIGKIGLFESNESNLFINQRVGIIRSQYYKNIYYNLKTDLFLKYIEYINQSSAQPNISGTQIGNFYISIDATYLEFLDYNAKKIDILLKNQQQQIEKIKEYKQRLISEVVTKGLNPNVEYKDSGIKWIGQIPIHWKIVPLKYSHLITMGQSPKSESYNTEQIGKPFLGGNSDIKDGYSNPKYYTTEITKTCDKSDILMSVRAPVGTIALSLHDAVLGRGLCSIKSKISNEYSYFYMKFLENKWSEYITGTTFESVNFDDIQNMPYIMPSTMEIKSLLGYLKEKTKKIDGLIKIKNDKIMKLSEYKKSLIYEYVTGKKEVQ